MIYLFDIDGTLLLAGGAGRRALNRAFAKLHDVHGAMDGVSPGGKTDAIIVTEAFNNSLARAPSEQEIDDLLTHYVPLFEEEVAVSPGFHLMPSVVEVLEHLGRCRSSALGIATGNIRAGAEAKLARAGLGQHFAFGGYGCDDPDRAGLVEKAIRRGLDHVGDDASRDRVVVVGDTLRDIQAARQCGVRVIIVTTGSQDREELHRAQPDALFETLAELPAWHREHACSACPSCRLLDGDDRARE